MKTKKSNPKPAEKYFQEYVEIFKLLDIDLEKINPEWKKEGDTFKEYSMYEDERQPILTNNTYLI